MSSLSTLGKLSCVVQGGTDFTAEIGDFTHCINTPNILQQTGKFSFKGSGDLCSHWDPPVWGRCFTLLYSGGKVGLSKVMDLFRFASAYRPMHRELPHSEKTERIIL